MTSDYQGFCITLLVSLVPLTVGDGCANIPSALTGSSSGTMREPHVSQYLFD